MDCNKNEFTGLDILKFVLSIFICIHHTLGEIGGISWVYPITRVAVPTFFPISGFLYFRKAASAENKKKVYTSFLKRNAVLYSVWFILLLPITITRYSYFINGIVKGLFRFIVQLLFGSTFPASWFLPALVLGVGLLVLMDKFLKTKTQMIVGAVFYCICVLTSNYRGLISPDRLFYKIFVIIYPGTVCRSFPVSILPLVIGKHLAEKNFLIEKNTQKDYSLLAISCVLLYIEHILIERLGCCVENDCYFTLPLAAYALFMVCAGSKVKLPCAKKLRNLSTINYCAHLSVVSALRGRVFSDARLRKPAMSAVIFFVTEIIVFSFGMAVLALEKNKKFRWLK